MNQHYVLEVCGLGLGQHLGRIHLVGSERPLGTPMFQFPLSSSSKRDKQEIPDTVPVLDNQVSFRLCMRHQQRQLRG